MAVNLTPEEIALLTKLANVETRHCYDSPRMRNHVSIGWESAMEGFGQWGVLDQGRVREGSGSPPEALEGLVPCQPSH